MRLPGRLLGRLRLQSSLAQPAFSGANGGHLDLDFVLSLLDAGRVAGGSVGMRQDASVWTRMKLRPLSSSSESMSHRERVGMDAAISRPNVTEKEHAPETARTDASATTRLTFMSLLPTTRHEEGDKMEKEGDRMDSALLRVQTLADALPYGNSELPFFHFDKLSAALATTTAPTEDRMLSPVATSAHPLPMPYREDAAWESATITSILRKLVPEEAFMDGVETETTSATTSETTSATTSETKSLESTTTGTDKIAVPSLQPAELKLLDHEQLHGLARALGLSIAETDSRLEKEIARVIGEQSTDGTRKTEGDAILVKTKKELHRAGEFAWTAENEAMLLELHDRIRAEKNRADVCLQQYLSSMRVKLTTGATAGSKRKTRNRGLWAVLAERFSGQCGAKVTMTECRRRLFLLKRLQH